MENPSRYIYIYRIEQCALPVTTILALWQLVNLGTRCTVTHCRIALWSHQSAQTAGSERCISIYISRKASGIFDTQLTVIAKGSETGQFVEYCHFIIRSE